MYIHDSVWKSAKASSKISPSVSSHHDDEIPNPYDMLAGERGLWRAVITQALMDAANQSKKKEDQEERARARAWLGSKHSDFNLVCHLADLDPEFVREQARKAMDRGCKWRKGPRCARLEKEKREKKQQQAVANHAKSSAISA